MSGMESDDLYQKALLWAANGVNDYGQYKVDAKVEIDVRWQEERRQGINAQGDPIAIEATVVVDREIAVGSVMWQGSEEDLVTNPPTGLKQVLSYRKIPDIKSRSFRRVVILGKLSDTLPDLA